MRGFSLLLWLALAPTAFVQAAPLAEDSAQVWLERLSVAGQSSFQGTFVYERNGSFSTHAIWHRLQANGQVRERLLQQDGPAQEVLRLDGHVQCMSQAQAEQFPPLPSVLNQPLSAAQLAAHYDARILGQSRVAGHAAVVLALLPRDPYRYALELHVDQQSGLLLKSLLLNEQGQLLERFQFTALDSRSAVAERALQVSADCLAVAVAPAASATVSPWQPSWLPPGFSLIATQQRSDGEQSLTWLLFSDGLARFSVFVEPLPNVAVENLHTQLGPTVVVSRQLTDASGPLLATLVGEVPLLTAERVAQSLVFTAESRAP